MEKIKDILYYALMIVATIYLALKIPGILSRLLFLVSAGVFTYLFLRTIHEWKKEEE